MAESGDAQVRGESSLDEMNVLEENPGNVLIRMLLAKGRSESVRFGFGGMPASSLVAVDFPDTTIRASSSWTIADRISHHKDH